MACSCPPAGAGSPLRSAGFLPGVEGCDGVATNQVAVPDALYTERVQVMGEVRNVRSRTLLNAGSTTVYLGGRGVTSSTGFPLAPGSGFTTEYRGEVYACTAPGDDGTVAWWQESNDPNLCR